MGKYSLLLVSALIFSMIAYSYAVRNALFQSNLRTVQSYSFNQAHNIAQSAAMIAINDIRNNNDSDFNPESGETYWYPSENQKASWQELHGSYRLKAVNQADTLLLLESRGWYEETNYVVTIGVTTGGFSEWDGGIIDKAVHSENNIDMGNGFIDGDVSLNNSQDYLELKGSINGNFFFYDENMEPGVTSSDDGDGGGGKGKGKGGPPGGGNNGISGDTVNMPEKINHPNPVFPEFPKGYMPANDNGKQYMFPTDYEFLVFDQFTASNTTIDVGDKERILYAKNIDLSGGLNVVGEGLLSIYVEDNINLGNGNINASRSSEHLTLFYKGSNNIDYTGNGTFSGTLFAGNHDTKIKIAGTPNFKGHIISLGNEVTLNGTPTVSSLVYAPNATVSLKGTGRPGSDFRGAIVSNEFTANGKASVIYDAAFASTLPSLKQDTGDGEYNIAFWN